jgi:hypothetical protein
MKNTGDALVLLNCTTSHVSILEKLMIIAMISVIIIVTRSMTVTCITIITITVDVVD